MLDMYLEVAYREQEKLASQNRYLELMMKLPDAELHEMAKTGHVKVGYFGSGEILGKSDEGSSWLDHFKGTPLHARAISLLEEELKMQAANDQRDVLRDQERSQNSQQRDTLRLQKRLLELELVKQQSVEASAAQPPPQPSPGMGAPPGMTAQGAGAMGDVPAEGAVDSNPQKMAAAKEEKKPESHAHHEGRVIGENAHLIASGLGAYNGATAAHRMGKALGKGPHGRLALAAGGAIGGGLLGHSAGKFLQGAVHGASHAEDDRQKEKKGGVGDFLRAAAPAVGNFVKEHPGAAIGGGLGALHGLTRRDGGVGSAVLEGAGGAALGHGAQHMYENGGADKLRSIMGKSPPEPATATVSKEAASRPLPFVGEEKRAFGAFLGALGGMLAGAGARAAATGAASGALGTGAKGLMSGGLKGLATTGMNWAKSNPLKAVGGAMGAAANFAQARQQGQGVGGAALSGLAGGASALG